MPFRVSTRRAPERSRSLALVALVAMLTACDEAGRSRDFDSVASPGGEYVLTATVVEPWFPQGPWQVAIFVQAGATAPRIEVARTELAYDGVPFTRHNIGMRWVGERTAIVCLRATDRPDRSVRVDARGATPSGELRDGC